MRLNDSRALIGRATAFSMRVTSWGVLASLGKFGQESR